MVRLADKLTTDWFKNHIKKSIKIAGPRYTPELNVELPIAEIFDGLCRTKQFYNKIGYLLGKIRRSGTIVSQKTFPSEAISTLNKIQTNLNSILSMLTKVNNSGSSPD